MKLLIVGEAPNRNGDPTKPIEGMVGHRLAVYAGLTPAKYRRRFTRVNVFNEWPGNDGKGSRFDMAEARMHASVIRLKFKPGLTVVMLGKRVARAFSVQPDYFTMQFQFGAIVVVVPHPSGVNRWFNDARNRWRMNKFMTGLARLR